MGRIRGPARRRFGPRLESLEVRELPSSLPFLLGRPPRLGPPLVIRNWPGHPLPQGGMPVFPTPHERAREAFTATFSGTYRVGPGRFTDQASQTYFQGGGTATAFLNGSVQLGLFTPRDPSRPISGTATIFPRNAQQTGNVLILDLEGEPGAARDGRPARLRWTVNDASSGLFALAEGEGTLDLRYRGGLGPRGFAPGDAAVRFRGAIRTDGTTNLLSVR